MIWRIVSRYADLAGGDLAVDAATAYALVDGLFEQALLEHVTGDDHAGSRLRDRVADVLPRLLA